MASRRKMMRNLLAAQELPPCDGCGDPAVDEVDGRALCGPCKREHARGDGDDSGDPQELNFDDC